MNTTKTGIAEIDRHFEAVATLDALPLGGRQVGQVVRINGHVRAEVVEYLHGHAHAVRIGKTDSYLYMNGRWLAAAFGLV